MVIKIDKKSVDNNFLLFAVEIEENYDLFIKKLCSSFNRKYYNIDNYGTYAIDIYYNYRIKEFYFDLEFRGSTENILESDNNDYINTVLLFYSRENNVFLRGGIKEDYIKTLIPKDFLIENIIIPNMTLQNSYTTDTYDGLKGIISNSLYSFFPLNKNSDLVNLTVLLQIKRNKNIYDIYEKLDIETLNRYIKIIHRLIYLNKENLFTYFIVRLEKNFTRTEFIKILLDIQYNFHFDFDIKIYLESKILNYLTVNNLHHSLFKTELNWDLDEKKNFYKLHFDIDIIRFYSHSNNFLKSIYYKIKLLKR